MKISYIFIYKINARLSKFNIYRQFVCIRELIELLRHSKNRSNTILVFIKV